MMILVKIKMHLFNVLIGLFTLIIQNLLTASFRWIIKIEEELPNPGISSGFGCEFYVIALREATFLKVFLLGLQNNGCPVQIPREKGNALFVRERDKRARLLMFGALFARISKKFGFYETFA